MLTVMRPTRHAFPGRLRACLSRLPLARLTGADRPSRARPAGGRCRSHARARRRGSRGRSGRFRRSGERPPPRPRPRPAAADPSPAPAPAHALRSPRESSGRGRSALRRGWRGCWPGRRPGVWRGRAPPPGPAQRGATVNPVLEPLIKTVRAMHPKAVRLIERSYEVATAQRHRNQKRKSGDPYITHPLAVATILAELLGMNTDTISAAPPHDTVEDTPYSLAESCGEFGEDIAAGAAPRSWTRSLNNGLRRGGDRLQDGRRDVAGHPGPGHQAGHGLHNTAARCATSPGNNRSASPARCWRSLPRRPPAGHEHDQGAGRPRLRDHVPQAV